jgi:hypothetical protein
MAREYTGLTLDEYRPVDVLARVTRRTPQAAAREETSGAERGTSVTRRELRDHGEGKNLGGDISNCDRSLSTVISRTTADWSAGSFATQRPDLKESRYGKVRVPLRSPMR